MVGFPQHYYGIHNFFVGYLTNCCHRVTNFGYFWGKSGTFQQKLKGKIHTWFYNPFPPSVAKIVFSKFGFIDYYLYTIYLVTPPQNRKGSGQLLFGQNNNDQTWLLWNWVLSTNLAIFVLILFLPVQVHRIILVGKGLWNQMCYYVIRIRNKLQNLENTIQNWSCAEKKQFLLALYFHFC